MKKLALLLALLMLLTVGVNASSLSGDNEYPITTEPLTLRVWVPESNDVADVETNTMTVEYEKLTGVKIEWTIVPAQEATTKFNLEIAGGSYHDIYSGFPITSDQIMMCIEGGVLRPLNDLIEKYGPNTRQAFAENPEFEEYLTAPDGNIYALFTTDVGSHMVSQNKMFVYQKWLDKLDMELPKTTEEFKQMLIAFRDTDMNGNGDANDEMPLVSSFSSWCGDPLGFLMNPFQLYNSNFFVITDDNRISFVANTDGWREGLRYIHDLYSEGLIAQETYVQDQTQLRAIVNQPDDEKHIAGAVSAAWQGVFVDASIMNWTDFVAIEPLEGPTGLKQAGATKGGTFSMRGSISTQCEHPEAAFKWLDYWIGYEGTFNHTWGMVEGTDYEWVDSPSFAGDEKSVKRLQGMGDSNVAVNYRWGAGWMPKYDRYEIRYAATLDPTNFNTNNTYVLVEAAKPYEPYYVYHNIPQVVWSTDSELAAEVAEMQIMINDYIKAAATEFVTGVRDIEKDWEGYLQELDGMGLERYIALLERYYIK